jgi:hypothetical protein
MQIDRRVEADAREFRILDTWTPTPAGAGVPWSRMLWATPVGRLREVEFLDDRMGFRFPGEHPLHNVSVRIRATGAKGARLCVAESFYSAEFGRTREATETIVITDRTRSPVSVETQIQIA